MKKAALAVVLVLCFVAMPELKLVDAIGTVYIRSDGSVAGAGLKLSGGTYVFKGDIYGEIIIEKDGIVVDGSGYTLYGMGEGGVFLENRSSVVLRVIQVVDAPFGITVFGGSNNEITQSNCTMSIENSFNNTICGNERVSLLFTNSSKNLVKGNNLTDNTRYGLKLQSSSNENTIFANNITGSIGGIEFHGQSCFNTVRENWIVKNADGMIFYYGSNNNTVFDNVIAFNSNSGMFFRGASHNRFFRNDVVENHQQLICWYCTNIWDNGQTGNYWSDYNGTDSDGDGIGDEPYLILTLQLLTGEYYETDTFPLMKPTKNHVESPELTPVFPTPNTTAPSSTSEPSSTVEPFPETLAILASVGIALAIIGLLFCFKKR